MSKKTRLFFGVGILVLVVMASFLIFRRIQFVEQLSGFDPQMMEEDTLSGYAGSRSCRECHERFYQLWSPSHHGKAMQPVRDALQSGELSGLSGSIKVGAKWYQVSLEDGRLFMLERDSKDTQVVSKKYEAIWALGGRNVYYFLTPFESGRLQTMPLAYDVNKRAWYGNPQSAVRHFVDTYLDNEPLDWTHPLYTFNTACHSCHVSQLSKNYDDVTNTYHTTWKEPGINCETCHGPSEEHVKVCREAAKSNEDPVDFKIIRQTKFTSDQYNASCAACHAKGMLLTETYTPGEPFYQHFDLVTLENPDYYPDGRDLGENYTLTSWLQSSCVTHSDLHCVACHTSSGRYRFKGHSNDACVKCHEEKISKFDEHTRHKPEDSLTCISCHMPVTAFARMTRSDHSMRPPMPAATLAFKSPNACNICHDDKDAQWANQYVTKWHGRYQDETLRLASLIYAGRNGDFKNADQMYAMIDDTAVNVIFRNSMIRILMNYEEIRKEKYLLKAFQDRSPLIRASVAEALQFVFSEDSKKVLLTAAQDSFRIVRLRASTALASFPEGMFTQEEQRMIKRNYNEYTQYLTAYPDNWTAFYNLGNFYQNRGMYQQAIDNFNKATKLDNTAVSPLVNASIAYSVLNDNASAEQKLRKALEIDPKNAAANLNYGLLLAQSEKYDEAVYHLKIASSQDSVLGTAAYNLAVISAQSDLKQALEYALKAYRINPDNTKFGYTYAYYLAESGASEKAVSILNEVVDQHPDYIDGYLFLADIYEKRQELNEAIHAYEKAAQLSNMPEQYRQNILARINALKRVKD